MFEVAFLATALWVCPDEVYTNEPRAGCKPFQPSNREAVSTVPEPGAEPAPTEPARSDRVPAEAPPPRRPSAPSELCALYKEYIALELKTHGGFVTESTEEVERWQTLKRMFQNSPAPACP